MDHQVWPRAAAGIRKTGLAAGVFCLVALALAGQEPASGTLPGTPPLTLAGDLASNLVAGTDRFLSRKLAESVAERSRWWRRDCSSPAAYEQSVAANRRRLAEILGLRETRAPFTAPEVLATTAQNRLAGRGMGYEIYEVRWPAFGDAHGEGLLLVPEARAPLADVLALPDCEQTPEQLAGLVEGVPPASQLARRLAESGCRVLAPALINRNFGPHKGKAKMSAREFLHRSAFELGRQLAGYEILKIQAATDWLARDAAAGGRIGVIGYGEGGLLALYAAALDPRLKAACVSGYFGRRENVWQEPLDRNFFGLLKEFGDAEVASLVSPRPLLIELCRGPEAEFSGAGGGAPARLVSPPPAEVRREVARARELTSGLPGLSVEEVLSGDGTGPFGSQAALELFLARLAPGARLAPEGEPPRYFRRDSDPRERQARLFHELDRHNQALLAESPYVRAEFMKKLDTASVNQYEAVAAEYRRIFRERVIGWFEEPLLPANPRARLAYEREKWNGYEVVLDVYPDVIAYGVLLLPKDLAPGERRPVVVCQHGLEGRPADTFSGNHPAYHDFAAQLAERGFIVFAPQNLYLFRDRFRELQRKANPLGKTLFSIITPQHQQILEWLKAQPFVDGRRIAFYGLSYGGKTAMRVPALLTDYCLSICSADFNDWVWKNASSRSPYSYVWTGEYEIFEWDLGGTFNYAEMAALIAPRPFMVERGHFDGVAPDETVAYEFAKVRRLYAARLMLPDRVAIEWFPGPHTINGRGTFDFLHRHLNWPVPAADAQKQEGNQDRRRR